MATPSPAAFADLLQKAVTEPGIVSAAYRQFHNFSIGNQLLAWSQCIQRSLTPGPIATFMGWKQKGRHVNKGEKAITLCMPVTCKRRNDELTDDDGPTTPASPATLVRFTRFVYKPHWFVLAQTEGQELPAMPVATWDRAKALTALGISEEPFAMLDGNVQGYARQRTIAVSPVAAMPFKTTVHEAAHVLLGHTSEGEQTDSEITPRNLRECEAEAVAMLCCAALDQPGVGHCRGYIQSWWGAGNPIPERQGVQVVGRRHW
jgi:antirestriction protein ArdC